MKGEVKMKVKKMVDLFDGNVAIKFYRNGEMVFCGGKEDCNPKVFDDYADIENKEVIAFGVEVEKYDDNIPNLRIVVGE